MTSLTANRNRWTRGLPLAVALSVAGLSGFAGDRVLKNSEHAESLRAFEVACEVRSTQIQSATAVVIAASKRTEECASQAERSRDRLASAKTNLDVFRDFVEHAKPVESREPMPATDDADKPAIGLGDRPNPRYEQIKHDLDQIKDRREELMLTYTAAHPQVRDLQLQIAQLTADLENESPQLPLSDAEKLALAGSKIAVSKPSLPEIRLPGLDDPDANQQPKLPASPGEFFEAARHLKELTVAVETAEAETDRLSMMLHKAETSLAESQAAQQMAEIAPLPERKSAIDANAHPLAMFFNGLLAIILGLVSGWSLWPRRRQVIRDVAQLRQILQLPVLGVISANTDVTKRRAA